MHGIDLCISKREKTWEVSIIGRIVGFSRFTQEASFLFCLSLQLLPSNKACTGKKRMKGH